MQEIIFTAVRLIVMVAAALITTYVVPYVRQKAGAEKLEELAQWTAWAVNWAEQVIVAPGSGAERYAKVLEFLKEVVASKGIKLTDKQIEILVEAAVRQMHLDEAAGIIEVPEAVESYTSDSE